MGLLQEYKSLYIEYGFQWSRHLESLVRDYGGQELEYPHPRAKTPVKARLCHIPLIKISRYCGQIEMACDFLGEEIAPVGDCSDGNIELLLSESGRLFGFRDYTLYSWSFSDAPNWQISLSNMLLGNEPEILADIPL